MNELTEVNDTEVRIIPNEDPILNMIDRVCSDPAFDISKMEKLMDMRNADLARKARKEFTKDFALMQADLPQVEEKASGHNIKYASFEHINEKVQPVLRDYGFAMSFRINQTDKAVIVKAILMHKEGHSEETEITLPLDSSGSKNSVQAVGSSTSYGKRYAMCALLNIVTKGEDDNANEMNEFISEEQAIEIEQKLEEVKADKAKFIKGYMKVNSIKEIPLIGYGKALKGIEAKRRALNESS